MFSTILSIFSEEAAASASASCDNIVTAHHEFGTLNPTSVTPTTPNPDQPKTKKKRNLPGNPDPEAEVIALSPKTLMATNRFVCEICSKGFQRDQNLQLHRRGHNLPWKLKQRNNKDARKRVYVCPEATCVHHDPSRALGDLTGIKKHFCRKHGEKKWKCEKCSKIYAVQSDWKAHSKTCGTREYRCDCGTLFSRKDSFVTHRAFCDALAEESARLCATNSNLMTSQHDHHHHHHQTETTAASLYSIFQHQQSPNPQISLACSSPFFNIKPELTVANLHQPFFHYTPHSTSSTAVLSATALLQKAATVGATGGSPLGQTQTMMGHHVSGYDVGLTSTWRKADRLTRDFLGLTADDDVEDEQTAQCSGGGKDLLTYSAAEESVGLGFSELGRDPSVLRAEGFGLAQPHAWRDC
ncbi:unnamed protein product [Rhodiola kirilowii]